MGDGNHSPTAAGEPRVLVDDRQDPPVDAEPLRRLASEVLRGEGVPDAELSLSFVTEDEIADLHERYLHEEGPTDVLSFPLDEDDVDEDGVRILGDVVIAPSVAARNNREDPVGEMRLLVVHGILHLLGHDHMDETEHAEMWARQARYVEVRVP